MNVRAFALTNSNLAIFYKKAGFVYHLKDADIAACGLGKENILVRTYLSEKASMNFVVK